MDGDVFYYRNGFIIEKKEEGDDELVADFFAGIPALPKETPLKTKRKIERIIKLLNLGYKSDI